jgi:ATP-binding cassette subfamily F protein 3
LLEDPGLLVLDEPTNHLDLDAIEWLEAWLRDWPGAALVVSHDRYFLDRVAASVWELAEPGLSIYPGNYSAYLRQRDERRVVHVRRYEAQQEYLARQQDYIRRNIAGQNTRQAKGRRKRLERWLEDEALERPTETAAPHPPGGESTPAKGPGDERIGDRPPRPEIPRSSPCQTCR